MFDIAFSELVVIALVALVVIGPERLPKVARTAGHLWGRMQRYVYNVKNEIANDMALEEAKKLGGSIKSEVASIEQSLHETGKELEQNIVDAQSGKPRTDKSPGLSGDQVNPAGQPPTSPGKPV